MVKRKEPELQFVISAPAPGRQFNFGSYALGSGSKLLFSRAGSSLRRTPVAWKSFLNAEKNILRLTPKNLNLFLEIVDFSVADPDPGSGAFFTPGSGIRVWETIRIRDEHPRYFS